MSNKIKFLIVIGMFVFVFTVLAVVALVSSSTNQKSTDDRGSGNINQNIYVDPYSGETVLNPTGKAKEPIAGDFNLLGFYKLLDIGVSQLQLDLLTGFLGNYADNKTVGDSAKITEISLVVKSIRQNINEDTGQITITSDIVINREFRQKITINYINSYGCSLQILNLDGETLGSYPQGD
jgi:hypothetical protein